MGGQFLLPSIIIPYDGRFVCSLCSDFTIFHHTVSLDIIIISHCGCCICMYLLQFYNMIHDSVVFHSKYIIFRVVHPVAFGASFTAFIL